MTAKEKILKLMSRRHRTHAGDCIDELGLNPNTARGRLSELNNAGLTYMVHRGTHGVAGEYAEYVLTGRGSQAASLLPVNTTTNGAAAPA
jgi:predicted ArsR family transcriptional regulator